MNASRSGGAQHWSWLIERGSAGGWDEALAQSNQRCLDAVLGRDLGHDGTEVDQGGLPADEPSLRDLGVRAALADEGQDLDLEGSGQPKDWRITEDLAARVNAPFE